MKNFFYLLMTFIAFPSFGQSDFSEEYSYDIHVVDAPLAISKATVESAKTLFDLNKYYKPDWVKRYESVEITTTQQGKTTKVTSINDELTEEQKTLLNSADEDTDITIEIVYLPENNLKYNDLKEHNFSFKVIPEKEAAFVGSDQQLKQYLKENTIDKIPYGTLKEYALAAVKFTVDETGKIINPYVFESTKNEKIDALLLEAIIKMPSWQPAEFANGLKVKQEFVLTVGDMRSCIVNTLNIR